MGVWEKTDRSQQLLVVGLDVFKAVQYLLNAHPGQQELRLAVSAQDMSRTDISLLGTLRAFLKMKEFAA